MEESGNNIKNNVVDSYLAMHHRSILMARIYPSQCCHNEKQEVVDCWVHYGNYFFLHWLTHNLDHQWQTTSYPCKNGNFFFYSNYIPCILHEWVPRAFIDHHTSKDCIVSRILQCWNQFFKGRTCKNSQWERINGMEWFLDASRNQELCK